jgi:hypothetical protein
METPKNNPVEKLSIKSSFDLKLSIITEINNGQISANYASKNMAFLIGTLAYWIKNCLTLNQNPKL